MNSVGRTSAVSGLFATLVWVGVIVAAAAALLFASVSPIGFVYGGV